MTHLLSCRHCATVHSLQARRVAAFDCHVCGLGLERLTGRSLDRALATSIAALVLLLPANGLPFLTTRLFGAAEHSHLISSAEVLWNEGWPGVAVVVALLVMILPILRFALLTAVLGALRLGLRPHWLGPVFRASNELQTWAMADVFLVAFLIAYARLAATVSVALGPGAYCLIGAGLLILLSRATLDKAAIWRLIQPQPPVSAQAGVISCDGCGLLAPMSALRTPCPRCDKTLEARKKNAVGRAAALTLAAVVVYLPANVYPIATIPINLRPTAYNILGGVIDLAGAHLYGLAGVVLVASFVIPILKLTAMAWFIHAVRSHARKAPVLKTRLFQFVDEIGRWSMVDPFTIAAFVPVVRFNALLTARAETAAPFFTAVVILTILAAKVFDPRLMWDVSEVHA
jgi:paraquat-inducible protein A